VEIRPDENQQDARSHATPGGRFVPLQQQKIEQERREDAEQVGTQAIKAIHRQHQEDARCQEGRSAPPGFAPEDPAREPEDEDNDRDMNQPQALGAQRAVDGAQRDSEEPGVRRWRAFDRGVEEGVGFQPGAVGRVFLAQPQVPPEVVGRDGRPHQMENPDGDDRKPDSRDHRSQDRAALRGFTSDGRTLAQSHLADSSGSIPSHRLCPSRERGNT
jgi:hypothetical protein